MEMLVPEMTDPMDALRSFQPAFRAKKLDVRKGELDSTILVHADQPEGEPRFTYVKTNGSKVTALAIIIRAEPIAGEHCFAIGYAVPEDERGMGQATKIVQAALAEFQHGLARNDLTTFHIEAVVDKTNLASQKVAARTLTAEPRDGRDSISGKPVFVYSRRFQGAPLA